MDWWHVGAFRKYKKLVKKAKKQHGQEEAKEVAASLANEMMKLWYEGDYLDSWVNVQDIKREKLLSWADGIMKKNYPTTNADNESHRCAFAFLICAYLEFMDWQIS
ncbi:hypothetical protein [Marispirochaeta aestuarii]|uniref:hypothetical protein n=1 Tax=Marispirochaeta aestuarii TaxID=1963862 RepID=UPI0029C7A523|nr:hypothetical protein [Marispirochaeta aestuarii]